ncbi:MAG: UDP-N-acetylglucosamine 2-epimerase [Methylotenera sp.]|jgi:UDP-GlcNAc3NAcA epimerase|nr:UDP-N-acetylglucosamine 2-epimerase [Methylotenera sp.]MDO9389339.1 UDP-N-acetylglucosamine 2-epimerase [Methylotenera sp.]
MKIITIIGARPKFAKATVVSRAFREHSSTVRKIITHTGQHYDVNMTDVFFDELDILKPGSNLTIGDKAHGQSTGRIQEAIEVAPLKEKPNWLRVYGDIDSSLANTLVAMKLHTPVAYI